MSLINFPVKGVGLKIHSDGDKPSTLITDKDGWRVADIDFLSLEPHLVAIHIMYLLTEASEIGFKQGQEHVRNALGLK